MKNLSFVLFIAILSGCATHVERQPSSHIERSCFNYLRTITTEDLSTLRLSQRVTPVFKKTHKRSKLKKAPASIKAIYKFLDGYRKILQRFHKHEYPITSIDTAPEAYAWAKKAFGQLDAESEELINYKKVTAEVRDRLSFIKSYQADLEKMRLDMSNLQVKITAMKKHLKTAKDGPQYVPYYQVQVKPDGSEVLNHIEEYVADPTNLSARIKGFEKDLKSLKISHKARIYNQLLKAKEVSLFYHEFQRVKSLAGKSAEATEESKKLIDEITEVFEKAHNGLARVDRLDKEFEVPEWAKRKLKRYQAYRQTLAIFIKDIPKLTDFLRLNKILKSKTAQELSEANKELDNLFSFIEKLKPHEKRALGLEGVSKKINRFKAFRLRVLGWLINSPEFSVLTGLPLATGGVITIIGYIRKDAVEKEACAEIEPTNFKQFAQCAQKYLDRKFPPHKFKDEASFMAFLDGNEKLKNPEILKEIEDILRRRYIYTQRNNYQERIIKLALEKIAEKDMGSDIYRMAMVELPQKEFEGALLDKDMYLDFRYGLVYARKEVRELVFAAVIAADKGEVGAMNTAIAQLMKIPDAKILAKDLQGLLRIRLGDKKAQSSMPKLDKILEELRGTNMELPHKLDINLDLQEE